MMEAASRALHSATLETDECGVRYYSVVQGKIAKKGGDTPGARVNDSSQVNTIIEHFSEWLLLSGQS